MPARKHILGALLCGGLLVSLPAACLLIRLDRWASVLGDSPEQIEARRHWELGHDHEQAGRLDDAIAEYRLATRDGWYPMGTRHMADLLEEAGRFEDALLEIDRVGPAVSPGEYCDLRTDCLQQWKGIDAAVDWLHEMDASRPDSPFFLDQLGSFHLYGGRPARAIEPLLEAERRGLRRQKLRFNNLAQLENEPGAPEHGVNDLCDLWPTLESLARAYEDAGDDEHAFEYGTRAVSLHSRINQLNGYFGPRWQEAGSFTGRMVRARVLLRRNELERARLELEFAELVKSNYSGNQRQLDSAWDELREMASNTGR